MRSFAQVGAGIDTGAVVAQLAACPQLWGQQRARIRPGSPHEETTDIWLRYRDLGAYKARYGSDMSHFCDEHESIWLEPAHYLPTAVAMSLQVQQQYGGTLGGVLLTWTPPGKCIRPHIDVGWHAEAHRKYYVALQVRPGAEFCWEDGTIRAEDGEVYWFRNDVLHWVNNDSDEDRLTMVVCLR